MSHSHARHCKFCNKPFYDDQQFDRFHDHHYHGDCCDHHRKHFNDFKRDDFFCEKFVCDDRFKVRLGGLERGLNFRLHQLIGCTVTMKVECGGECEEILAEICFVGTDFIEVKVFEESKKLTYDDFMEDETFDEESKKKTNKKKHKKKKEKKKFNFSIFPLDAVKSFNLKEDCDCDCDYEFDCDCDCDCH